MQNDKIRQISKQKVEVQFDAINKEIIEKAFDDDLENPDDYLTSIHFAFREKLNETMGTGRRIEGLSILWYFLYIKKFLEKALSENSLEIKFKDVRTETKKTYHFHYELNFKKNTIILSSDLSVEKNFKLKIHSKSSIRPDIFIGIKRHNEEVIPIAVFEVKLYQHNAKQIKEKILDRFIDMNNILNSNKIQLPFFVFLYLEHLQCRFGKKKQDKFNIQLENFKNFSKNARLMINRILKWEGEEYINKIEGSISKIMEEIVVSIKKL